MPLSTRARAAALAAVFVFALPAGLAFSQDKKPVTVRPPDFVPIKHRAVFTCAACAYLAGDLNNAIDIYNRDPSNLNKIDFARLDHEYDACVAICKKKSKEKKVHKILPPSISTVPPREDRHQP